MVRNSYSTSSKLVELVLSAERGEDVSLLRIQRVCKVGKQAAQDYLDFVKRHVPLGFRLVGGRKIWSRAGESLDHERRVIAAASAEFALLALDLLDGTQYVEQLREFAREQRHLVREEDIDRLDQFIGCFHRRRRRPPPDRSHSDHVETLLEAIRTHRRCAMRYGKLTDEPRVKDYVLEPWLLVHYGETLHFIGRKVDTGERRTFDVDGIQSLRIAEGPPFLRPPRRDRDPELIYRSCFGIYSNWAEPTRVILRVRGRHAVQLTRRRFHPSQVMPPTPVAGPGDWIEVSFQDVAVCPEFTSWVLGMLPDVQVLSPATFRNEISLIIHKAKFMWGQEDSG